jgi:PEP-CTERM motif
MTRIKDIARLICVALIVCVAQIGSTQADPFTASYTDGGSWNTIYAQGFNPSVNDGGSGHVDGDDDVVSLTRFQFFKSGSVDSATNIRLAILNNYSMNLDTLTTDSPELEGLSTNVIASTTSLAEGAPITFDFDGVNLTYGSANYYAAVYVNVGAEVDGVAPLTPVLVSSLVADYVEDPPAGSGIWKPETNYGDPDPSDPIDWLLAVSNYHHTDESGTFFDSWQYYADADFIASFDTTFASGLPGDYNENGVVDAADYTTWRDAREAGLTSLPNRNPLYEGVPYEADFEFWRAHYGESLGPGSGAAAGVASHAVPEPASAVLALLGGVAACWCTRKRSRVR